MAASRVATATTLRSPVSAAFTVCATASRHPCASDTSLHTRARIAHTMGLLPSSPKTWFWQMRAMVAASACVIRCPACTLSAPMRNASASDTASLRSKARACS